MASKKPLGITNDDVQKTSWIKAGRSNPTINRGLGNENLPTMASEKPVEIKAVRKHERERPPTSNLR
jgi:hypothetical protein